MKGLRKRVVIVLVASALILILEMTVVVGARPSTGPQARPLTADVVPTQIHVGVFGLRNNNGQVLCSLFSSAIAFPKKDDKAVAHYTAEISDRQASCEFSGIAPGTYAVSAFHDENSNGKLDANFMGIPREGVAASNDARGRLGPPKFNDAAFQVSGDQVNLKITITYLKIGRV